MALNAIERRMLMLARAALVRRKTHRICYAITEGQCELMRGPAAHVEKVKHASDRLRGFIMKAIEENFGFEDWVRLRGGAQAYLHSDREAMRSARIAWIDWLLDEPWTEWKGGACPVLSGEKVHVRCRDGYESTRTADTFRWNHINPFKPGPWSKSAYDRDIVAYKVMYEAPSAA